MEGSFGKWNLLQAAAPSFPNGAYLERNTGRLLNGEILFDDSEVTAPYRQQAV
jgi:hypothetical protein